MLSEGKLNEGDVITIIDTKGNPVTVTVTKSGKSWALISAEIRWAHNTSEDSFCWNSLNSLYKNVQNGKYRIEAL